MHIKFNVFIFFIACILRAVIVADEDQELQTKTLSNFCFDSNLEGYRLNVTILMTKMVSDWLACILECVTEPCCRSINYKKILIAQNESNCEMLHNTVHNSSQKSLQANFSFDHVYLSNPQKEYNESCFSKVLNGNIKGEDCADLYKKGNTTNGVYSIDPDGKGAFKVRCDMTTSGGGWTIIQRRVDGSVDFYRNWTDYKNGFGDPTGEYWLGLDKINRLTNVGTKVIRFDLWDTTGNTKYAEYSFFAIASEDAKYKLSLGTYSGTAGDSFGYQRAMPFSTRDIDNDPYHKHCAVIYKGAWWYSTCHSSNLNGFYYLGSHQSFADGVNWGKWKGSYYSLKKTEMKLRPS